MYYIIITAAALLFSLQFVFNDGYQKEMGSGICMALNFSLYSSISGLILMLVMNKFHISLSVFSVIVATAYGIVFIFFSYSSVKAFQYANLSAYSVFSMIGGMALPFIYGIFCGEPLTTAKLICFIFIVLSVFMTITKDENFKKSFKYYIAVFLSNGMISVISKVHQSYPSLCVDSTSFMILTKIITVILSITFIITLKDKSFKITKRALTYCAGYSVFNSFGNLMLLIALLNIPVSVQYPIVTGGVIVFSTIIDLIRKVKVTKREICAAIIAFISSSVIAL